MRVSKTTTVTIELPETLMAESGGCLYEMGGSKSDIIGMIRRHGCDTESQLLADEMVRRWNLVSQIEGDTTYQTINHPKTLTPMQVAPGSDPMSDDEFLSLDSNGTA